MLKQLLILFSLLLITMFFASCSTVKEVFEPKSDMDEVHEAHRPLDAQRLIPRQGYEGKLTNRVCTKWYGGECESDSTREYSLKDPAIRKRLIKLGFACRISGKRWRVCPNDAGFCRREGGIKECKKWGRTLIRRKKVCRDWGKSKTVELFTSIEEYGYLLDARTECKKGY